MVLRRSLLFKTLQVVSCDPCCESTLASVTQPDCSSSPFVLLSFRLTLASRIHAWLVLFSVFSCPQLCSYHRDGIPYAETLPWPFIYPHCFALFYNPGFQSSLKLPNSFLVYFLHVPLVGQAEKARVTPIRFTVLCLLLRKELGI